LYSLSDLTLYSPDVWLELFESYNKNIWPVQIVTSIFGLSLFYTAAFAGSKAMKLAYLGLGVCWLFVAVAHHYFYFTSINWMAYGYALLFLIQGVLLILFGLFSRSTQVQQSLKIDKTISISIVLSAVAVVPIAGFIDGRLWNQLDLFGVAPDSTALVTVGFLVATQLNYRWWLMIIPTIWMLFSLAGTWAIGMVQGLVGLSLVLIYIIISYLYHRPTKAR
jgi:hypothetical protein